MTSRLCLAAALFWLLLSGCSDGPSDGTKSVEATPTAAALLTVPDSVAAGQPVAVGLVTSGITPGDSLLLYVRTGWATYLVGVAASALEQTVPLPRATLAQSGDQVIRVLYGGRVLAQKNLRILPLPPAAPLDIYLGAKSIVADGQHWSMVVAVPADKFNNPVAANTPVQFQMLRPNGDYAKQTAPTQYLVAYRRITANTLVGKTIVGVQTEGVFGKEKELLEVPGFPVDFSIRAANHPTTADGRQVFRVRTSELADRHHNPLPDGTLVQFQCTDADGTLRLLSGYTLRSVAEVALEHPRSAGSLLVQASVYGGGRSNRLAVPFTIQEKTIPIVYNRDLKRMRLGPLTESLDQLVPDGTDMTIQVDNQQAIQTEVVSGYASVDLRDVPVGPHSLDIRVAGRHVLMIVSIN